MVARSIFAGSNAMLRTSLASLTLAAALAALPAHAQVYKCIESGRTVYSQNPCPSGAQSTTIRRDAPTAPAPGAAKAGPMTAVEQEQEFRKRQKEKEEAQKKDEQKTAQADEKQRNCETARQQLAQYEIGGRIGRIDSKGERYYLDDAQIDQGKASAQASVRQWCGN